MNLPGKVAIVTGATKGIGRGIAEALAREGVRVCISARRESEIEEAVEALNQLDGAKAIGCVCDVRDHTQVNSLIEHATTALGGVDILVNNAGI